MHEGRIPYLVEYSYGGSDWNLEIWADDLHDAQKKLRALAANGRIVGEGVIQIKVPNWFGRLWARLFGQG